MLGVVIYLLCGAALAAGCWGTSDEWKGSLARELGRFICLTLFGPLVVILVIVLFFFSDPWVGRRSAG